MRCERKGAVDFLGKYVRPEKADGKYLPELSNVAPVEVFAPLSVSVAVPVFVTDEIAAAPPAPSRMLPAKVLSASLPPMVKVTGRLLLLCPAKTVPDPPRSAPMAMAGRLFRTVVLPVPLPRSNVAPLLPLPATKRMLMFVVLAVGTPRVFFGSKWISGGSA